MEILNYILLFTVPMLVGFSVFFINKSYLGSILEYIKVFGASFFLGVIVLHLLPEVFDHAGKEIGFFVALGFFSQLLLEAFTGSEPHDEVLPKNISKYSITLLIGLSIHSFFEGFPLSQPYGHMHHGHADETYLAGVLLHKIPVIAILVLMMLGSGLSKMKTGFQILIFSIMTPLGMLVGEVIEPGSDWSKYILAFVVGSISHIAMHLIVARDVQSGRNWKTLLKVILMITGFLLVYWL